MRVLVVTNFYPPHCKGGYELGCRDVVDGLRARGHEVAVLTSSYGLPGPFLEDGVYRWLRGDFDLRSGPARYLLLFWRELRNRRAFRQVLSSRRPDVVYLWNLSSVSASLALWARDARVAVCYFVSDHWLAAWDSDPWYAIWARRSERRAVRAAKAVLRPLLGGVGLIPRGSPEFSWVQFASRFLHSATTRAQPEVARGEVIHLGIDVTRWPARPLSNDRDRLLYVGRLVPEKGLATAVEAVRILVQEHGRSSVHLTVVGHDPDSEYGREIRSRVEALGLAENVEFRGWVKRERLSDVYATSDILLLPSVWEEPFSLTVLEAMSSGLAVVGTDTGGSAEILRHEENALVFPKEDASACAAQVLRLIRSPDLLERLRRNGRRVVEELFSLDRMIDRVERSLEEAIACSRRGEHGGSGGVAGSPPRHSERARRTGRGRTSRVVVVSTFPPRPDGIARYAAQWAESVGADREVLRIGLPGSRAHKVVRLDGVLRPLRLLAATGRGDEVVVMWHPQFFLSGRTWSRATTYLAFGIVHRARRVQVIFHEPENVRADERGAARRIAAAAERAAQRWCWSARAELTFHSERERQKFLSRFDGARAKGTSRVVRHGARFRPYARASRREARERLGIYREGRVFVCIGFLGPHKGFDRAVEAFARLPQGAARLYLIGSALYDTPEVRKHVEFLRSRVSGLPGARLEERFVEDAEFDLWIRAADAVLLPYRSAASSSVAARARLLGTRVIATPVGALPEQLGPEDILAGSDEELAQALLVLSKEPIEVGG